MSDNSGPGKSSREKRLFSAFQRFLYPPERRWDVKGYGLTFAERFPGAAQRTSGRLGSTAAERATLMLTALFVGVVTGSAAALLKWCIALLSGWLTSGFSDTSHNWMLLLLPVAGFLAVSAYQQYLLHREISHGVERINYDFVRHRTYLPVSLTYQPMIAATITLGFGGSAGSEGPIAYTGAALGSNIASKFGLSPRAERVMTAIGAGAGIAGIFKAPIGGVLFTVEVLCIEMNIFSVAALFLACVASAVSAYLLSGCTPDIAFHHEAAISMGTFPLILLFGVFCGIYSTYFSAIMTFVRNYLEKMRNVWTRALVAGVTAGVLAFMFPMLYGEGYGSVGKLLDTDYSVISAGGIFPMAAGHTWWLLLLALAVMLAKPFATSSSNSGGGVSGDFAPTIMVGSVVGFAYAALCNTIPGIQLHVPDFIFMGMAGILAGAIRAPLMAMFLVTEMATKGYDLFMPVALVAGISYITVCALHWVRLKAGK